MKPKLIRRFPTRNAPPQKSTSTGKGYSGLQDELYYVEKEHIASLYRPIGLQPIGRFLSFCADSAASKKYFSKKRVNKMEVAHRKFGNEWGQFDRYCKLVLYHEAIDYLRELQRQSDHEKPLDALSPILTF